jgi:hypothetical protein
MCQFCNQTEQEIRDMGKIFGYPQCCIDEYIADSEYMKTHDDPRNEEQIDIAIDTFGFVPCKKHAKLIASGETTVALILINKDEAKSDELNAILIKEHN